MMAYPILKYFDYDHLPSHLQLTSQSMHTLAYTMADRLPRCEETEVGLRKVLEAKDCFVRAMLMDE